MNQISRRGALQKMGAMAAGAAMASGCATGVNQGGGKRPNIVFIYSDDHRWDAMSCMGHPWLETPNMDRLAKEGLMFENAFVTISLCGPSRASFLTGQYAHIHGVRTNQPGRDPKPGSPMFPVLLQDAGYQTAYIGKWHMDSSHANPRPGFDYWLSFRGQGVYFDPKLNENGRDFQAQGYMTDLLTDYAVNFLKQPREQPFCMILSHKAVHGPFEPAPRHRNAYEGKAIAKPESYDDDFADKPRWQRAAAVRGVQKQAMEMNEDRPVPDKLPLGPWSGDLPHMMGYMRALLAVDESVGAVYKTLEDMGQLDNTIVVYSSDNGFFQGEHRRGDKRLMYEESLRIPMLVRYPRMIGPGTKREEMALHIDLAPTLLDVAGVPVPGEMQGRSWVPLFQGKDVEWRKSFFAEYFLEEWVPGIPTMLAVRTERWKYITHPDIDDIDELYDLKNDPHEMNNLAYDPQYAGVLKKMKAEFERQKKLTGYTPMER